MSVPSDATSALPNAHPGDAFTEQSCSAHGHASGGTLQPPCTLQDSEIGPAFFEALERVRHIHADCRRLLRTHYQRAGLELMDAMAAHQEAAYERLCR